MSICDKLDAVRDYALDELPAGERPTLERHLASCDECAAELDRLNMTTAALRMLPDREIPQRIAFVSDKVFEPSLAARVFGGFWNSAARLGFASACLIAGALVFSAMHRPATEIRTVVAGSPANNAAPVDITQQVNDAVAKAVAQVRAEDAQVLKASLAETAKQREQEHQTVMEAIGVLQERQNAGLLLAASDSVRAGVGQ